MKERGSVAVLPTDHSSSRFDVGTSKRPENSGSSDICLVTNGLTEVGRQQMRRPLTTHTRTHVLSACLLACPFGFILCFQGSLRDAFREIDVDNNGSICVDELKMVVKKEGK